MDKIETHIFCLFDTPLNFQASTPMCFPPFPHDEICTAIPVGGYKKSIHSLEPPSHMYLYLVFKHCYDSNGATIATIATIRFLIAKLIYDVHLQCSSKIFIQDVHLKCLYKMFILNIHLEYSF